VFSELEAGIAGLVASNNSGERLHGLRLAPDLPRAPFAINRPDEPWRDFGPASPYKEPLMLAAESTDYITVRMCLYGDNASAILARPPWPTAVVHQLRGPCR